MFLFFYQVFDNYAVTVMIGGEPYTLGLFDTAGEKWNACVIVTAQDVVEVVLNMKTYSWFFLPFIKKKKIIFPDSSFLTFGELQNWVY